MRGVNQKIQIMTNEYPSSSVLKSILLKHGLTDEEVFRISIADIVEADRVGYVWRGEKTTKTMEGIIETLALSGITIKFAKIGIDRGLIYVNRY